MRPAPVTDQQTVALGKIPRVVSTRKHLHQSAVTVLAAPCRNSLAHNAAAGIFTDVNHLGPGIGLLEIVGYGHRVELRR